MPGIVIINSDHVLVGLPSSPGLIVTRHFDPPDNRVWLELFDGHDPTTRRSIWKGLLTGEQYRILMHDHVKDVERRNKP